MAAKSRSAKSAESTGWLRRSTLLLFLLLLVAGFLGGVIWAGRWGMEQLRGRDRYTIAFVDIECDPPTGIYKSKQEFLDEVLYKSRLPGRLHLLDEDLGERLREGFARHPWVEKVEAVQIKPPKHIVVKLLHRTPVLAVRMGDKLRAVDGTGVLLHSNAPTLGLPIYPDEAKPARGLEEGMRFGDPNVEAAARKLHTSRIP